MDDGRILESKMCECQSGVTSGGRRRCSRCCKVNRAVNEAGGASSLLLWRVFIREPQE